MGPSPSESVSAEGAKCHIIRDERKTDPSFDIISSNPYNYAYDVGRLILILVKVFFLLYTIEGLYDYIPVEKNRVHF
jgi:hypothetical protein